jgi:hypothetical protein
MGLTFNPVISAVIKACAAAERLQLHRERLQSPDPDSLEQPTRAEEPETEKQNTRTSSSD